MSKSTTDKENSMPSDRCLRAYYYLGTTKSWDTWAALARRGSVVSIPELGAVKVTMEEDSNCPPNYDDSGAMSLVFEVSHDHGFHGEKGWYRKRGRMGSSGDTGWDGYDFREVRPTQRVVLDFENVE
jgi:hypothetical protein